MAEKPTVWAQGPDTFVIQSSGNPNRSILSIEAISRLLAVGNWGPGVTGRFDPDIENPSWYWVDDDLLDELMVSAGWELYRA